MNILTHILMTKRVYADIDDRFSSKLSLGKLLWGSIKPDLTNTDISHCKDETFYLFYQKLEKVRYLELNKNKDKYSLELGEIFHYLCDYFCYAHNDKELLRYLPHIYYENNLHKTAKKMEGILYYNGYIDYSHLSFIELIEQKYKKYLSIGPSYENDILSSYEILMLIASKLARDVDLISTLGRNTSKLSVNIS